MPQLFLDCLRRSPARQRQRRDRQFKNERVEIDGKRFTSCTFDACELVYSGGDVEFGPGCVVNDCRPEVFESARRTVLLLHALGLLSFNPLYAEADKRPQQRSSAARA
jgi:hypothetical protein